MSAQAASRPDASERTLVEITAILDADAHLGTGAGAPGLNGLVARDRLGRPVIWASHLEGLLRDALLLRGKRGEAEGLFGKAGKHRQSAVFTSLYCQDDAAQFRTWRSTSRKSFDNRAPEDNTLRAFELVARGTQFVGQVDLPADQVERMSQLLHEVGAVGHGRSSGAGRIRFEIKQLDRAHRPHALEPGAPRLRLLLHNLDPMCIAATAMPGNTIPTQPFIPGRTLLGAIAAWLIEAGQSEAAKLLLEEQLAVSDALPLPWGNLGEVGDLSTLEVIPAPLALKHHKPSAHAGELPWWAWHEPEPAREFSPDVREPGAQRRAGEEHVRMKRPEADRFFARRKGEAWVGFRPTIRARLRNGRSNPDQLEPSLFAIEQLTEHTYFLAELAGESAALEQLSEALRPVLEGQRWLRVGRAGAPVEIAASSCKAPPAPAPLQSGLLTLTSDLLVRDPELRWFTKLSPEDFEHIADWPSDVTVKLASQEGTVVRGFNGTARLWRLPIGAVRRGSVFHISGAGVQKLQEAAQAGQWLGERCHEGFGRFRIDPDKQLPGVTVRQPSSERTRCTGSPDASDEARCAVAREWMERYRRALENQTREEREPSLSQWMDLVAELEAGDEQANQRRKDLETRGGMVWSRRGASYVLKQLDSLTDLGERAKHARMFVRWLRAELRGKPDDKERS